MAVCPSCGTENPQGQRFCGECGARLEAVPAPSEVRKTVTVLFADVVDSTGLGERLDPERVRTLMSRYFEVVRQALERHGASVEKFIGDAVMAVFGIPLLHEDDALRAVRAALDLAPAIATLEDADPSGTRLEVRVGLNTGMVVSGDPSAGQNLVTGDAVNVAARLQQSARPGEILIGKETYDLVRHAVEVGEARSLELKGKSGTVEARPLREVRSTSEAVVRSARSPLVGRKRQLRQLHQAFEAAVEDRSCQLFTVLGTAGVGKSRLVDEFIAGLEGARVASGRCLPYGEGITYWPLTEVLRSVAGVQETDRSPEAMQALVDVLGEPGDRPDPLASLVALSSGTPSPEEVANAARRFFERLGRERPLVVIFDDIHWAEPAFLDLIDHVVEWASQSPVLVVCMARPDLLDIKPGWGGGKVNAATVLLEPLDQEASEELIANVVGGYLDPALSKRILQSAEGNPLFVEEMVLMLLEDGALVEQDGVWRVGDPEQVRVPASLRVLLAARLDRLAAEERQVISRAAVVGKAFERQAVTALTPEEMRAGVMQHLGTLSRRELIRPDPGSDELYMFRHILIRDAAYDALPKKDRAELHEKFAAWLEKDLGEHAAEYEEILGFHLEQAFECWRDIGEQRDDLAERAGERLGSAGTRAVATNDFASAASLLERAIALRSDEDPDLPAMSYELVRALILTGQLTEARENVDHALESARQRGDERAEAWALAARSLEALGRFTMAEMLGDLMPAVRTLEKHGDTKGLARAWDMVSDQYNYLGQSRKALEAGYESIRYAVAEGDTGMELEGLGNQVFRGFWGHVPATDLLEMCAQLKPRMTRGSLTERLSLVVSAGALALLDRLPEAVEVAGEAVTAAREHSIMREATSYQVLGIVLIRTDLEEARRKVEWSDGIFERMGEVGARSSTAAMLADIALMMGDLERAEAAIATAREITVADDIDAVARTLAAESKLLALRGDERALVSGRRALETSEGTEYLLMRARALTLVAEAHVSLGDRETAADLHRRALAVSEEKGDVWSAARSRSALEQLGSTGPSLV